jgi:hypothetical protein
MWMTASVLSFDTGDREFQDHASLHLAVFLWLSPLALTPVESDRISLPHPPIYLAVRGAERTTSIVALPV